MWEFYLARTETSFRIDGYFVFQIQLAKRQTVIPMTRDYVMDREAALRDRERGVFRRRLAVSWAARRALRGGNQWIAIGPSML
jgi:cyclopropane-fatty-acyl-phospholipid synthase